jgi:hypothetical protein
MAAEVKTFRSRGAKLETERAAALRQLVLEFPEIDTDTRDAVVGVIDRRTASDNGWTFVMLSPAQNALVVNWLASNSTRPIQALKLWAALFGSLRNDTGEILRTRDELAVDITDTPSHVSTIMGELERLGAVSRRREKVAGMRGPGRVRWFMNPTIATRLPGAARDRVQSEVAPLRLVSHQVDLEELLAGGKP